jgi:putative spermidine/putrescine transport system permease protein
MRRLSAFFFRHPRLRLTVLASLPLAFLVVAYLGSLALLLVNAFWTTNSFTNDIVHEWTLENFQTLVQQPAYRIVTGRTLTAALVVTVVDALIALPIAFYMAKVASPRVQKLLVIAVLTPLWASYLVKAYAWRTLFATDGVIDWLLAPVGGSSPGYGYWTSVITLGYLWLPYMILPIYASLERLPNSLLDASADLGAKTWRTLRSVVLPVIFPGIVAGSIFTFSLTMGDYIAVQIVGGKVTFLGNVVYSNVTYNLPLAAALSIVPVVVILIYLALVRRTGALREL